MEPILLKIEDAAKLLGIGRSHMYGYVRSGGCQSVYLGKSRRIPIAALRQFAERLEAEQAEEART